MTRSRQDVVLVTVTFNGNQLNAHLAPLRAALGVREVVVVADKRTLATPGIKTVVPPRVLSMVLGRSFAKLLVLVALSLRLRPAWVIGFNLVPHGLNALVAARMTGARALYHQIGGPREWLGGGWDSDNGVLGRLQNPSRLIEATLLAAIRRMDLVAAMGTQGAEVLVRRGVPRSRVAVVPACVFVPEGDADLSVNADWDVVAVGALIPVKRTEDLLVSIACLKECGRTVRVAVVGDGPLRSTLESNAARLGISGDVEFLGHREDVHSICARSRVFVLPSRYEGLSIAMMDAMALGVPVVASDVGEIRDVIEPGETGFLYDVGDVATLASKIATLLDDETLRRRIGESARERAIAHAGIPAVVARLASAAGVLKGQDTPPAATTAPSRGAEA